MGCHIHLSLPSFIFLHSFASIRDLRLHHLSLLAVRSNRLEHLVNRYGVSIDIQSVHKVDWRWQVSTHQNISHSLGVQLWIHKFLFLMFAFNFLLFFGKFEVLLNHILAVVRAFNGGWLGV